MINLDKVLGQILGAGTAIDGKPFDGKSLAGGLLVGGLAGALTGKTGKKVASTALKVGGAAAVAGLAYSAYQRYKTTQGSVPNTAPAPRHLEQPRAADPWGGDVVDVTPLRETHFLPAPNDTAATESLSLRLIRAMIAAAKADGRIDDTESSRIFNHIDALGLEDDERQFLLAEISNPKSAGEIAKGATTPEEAAEIYAVSVMAVNPNGLAERLYLGNLSKLLKLEPALAESIHERVST